jgi:hypothetical protein
MSILTARLQELGDKLPAILPREQRPLILSLKKADGRTPPLKRS